MARNIEISDSTYEAIESRMKIDDTADSVIRDLLQSATRNVLAQRVGSQNDRSVVEAKSAAPKDQTHSSKPSQFVLESGYVDKYRRQLISPNTLPSRMLSYIEQVGRVGRDELKVKMVRGYGYSGTESGSMNASIKVLEVDGYIRLQGDDLIFVKRYSRSGAK